MNLFNSNIRKVILEMITVKYNHSTFDSLLIANIGFAWERKFRD